MLGFSLVILTDSLDSNEIARSLLTSPGNGDPG